MTAAPRPRIRLREAARALRRLLADPNDTAQVFRIIEALSGTNGERNLARLRRRAAGRRLLAERASLLDRLTDHAGLTALPEGSLGRAYLRFLHAEGLTAEGLRQASVAGRRYRPDELDPDLDFVRDRMRDSHDLWHVVTGYLGDLVGEAALLAFTFAQTGNPGIGFIVAVALLRGREPHLRRMIVRGFARGLTAAWLPATAWETLLDQPLGEVRRRLRVSAPPAYAPVRAARRTGA